MKLVSVLEAFCYDYAMTNKLQLIISVIVFTLALITSLILFHVDTSCVDIIGDGYAMGTDPKPVPIGKSCNHWQFIADGSDFQAHTLLSAMLALALGIITWGVVWITRWKNIDALKKFGIILLMLVIAAVGFIVTSAIVAAFSEGVIKIDQTNGMITVFLCLISSLLGSLALIRLIFHR